LYKAELILLAFTIPIYHKVVPYVIAAIVITWLLEGDFANKAKRVANCHHRLSTLLFAGIYLIYGIGLLYSSNFDYGYFDMEVKMSLFIFPVIMATVREEVLSTHIARKVLWAFVFGVLASFALCYSQAIFQYYKGGALEVFYYGKLSPLIHPSYLAMYVCFSIAIVLYFMLKGLIKGRIKRALAVLLIGIFELFVVMLSSKAGILGFVIVLALFSGYFVFAERRIARGLIVSAMLAGSFVFFFMVFPVSAERFVETRSAVEQADINPDETYSSTNERILIWWYSFEITNDHFLWGVGSGDVKDYLLDKYLEKEMHNALTKKLNAHNQYLQMMIALGIVGLIVLLLNLVLPALYAMEHKQYLFLVFLILLGSNFLFESMLEKQAGVVFYAFFNAYLFAIKKDPASLETGSHELS
jgi:O-antigen ligase